MEYVCLLIMKLSNPSVNSVDSSLYTREPFYKCRKNAKVFPTALFLLSLPHKKYNFSEKLIGKYIKVLVIPSSGISTRRNYPQQGTMLKLPKLLTLEPNSATIWIGNEEYYEKKSNFIIGGYRYSNLCFFYLENINKTRYNHNHYFIYTGYNRKKSY